MATDRPALGPHDQLTGTVASSQAPHLAGSAAPLHGQGLPSPSRGAQHAVEPRAHGRSWRRAPACRQPDCGLPTPAHDGHGTRFSHPSGRRTPDGRSPGPAGGHPPPKGPTARRSLRDDPRRAVDACSAGLSQPPARTRSVGQRAPPAEAATPPVGPCGLPPTRPRPHGHRGGAPRPHSDCAGAPSPLRPTRPPAPCDSPAARSRPPGRHGCRSRRSGPGGGVGRPVPWRPGRGPGCRRHPCGRGRR